MSVPFDNTSACHKKKETEAGPSDLATREIMSIRVHVKRPSHFQDLPLWIPVRAGKSFFSVAFLSLFLQSLPPIVRKGCVRCTLRFRDQ